MILDCEYPTAVWRWYDSPWSIEMLPSQTMVGQAYLALVFNAWCFTSVHLHLQRVTLNVTSEGMLDAAAAERMASRNRLWPRKELYSAPYSIVF